MVVSILLAVLFTGVEWGANSRIGLIIKSPVDEKGQVRLNSLGEPVGNQWMLNVGGTPRNSYSEGVQIPVYVVVFGIIGGYLRYLYDTARYVEARKTLEEEVLREVQYEPGEKKPHPSDKVQEESDRVKEEERKRRNGTYVGESIHFTTYRG